MNDGQPHKVIAARTNGQIWVQTDNGVRSQLIPDPYAIGVLPPLVVGTDSGPNGCGSGVVMPLAGSLTDLCVTTASPSVETDAGPRCLTDLSNVGTGDFHVAFTLATTSTNVILALVSQRGDCMCTGPSPYCPSPSTFWDVVMGQSGTITAITDDDSAASYVAGSTTSSVNDGRPHRIAVARSAGQLSIASDGALISATTADAYSFGTFPSLSIGSDSCGMNSTATTPLAGHGTLTDLCITTP